MLFTFNCSFLLQEESVKTVHVRGEDVPIKVIVLEDGAKKKAKVSLWRDASMSSTRPRDFVVVTDVVTNQFRGETSLSTTNRTKIEVRKYFNHKSKNFEK